MNKPFVVRSTRKRFLWFKKKIYKKTLKSTAYVLRFGYSQTFRRPPVGGHESVILGSKKGIHKKTLKSTAYVLRFELRMV